MFRSLALFYVAVSCFSCVPDGPPSEQKSSSLVRIPIAEIAAKDVYPRSSLLAPIMQQLVVQVEEKLPFDEPRHEWGLQLDGRLRPAWERAFFSKKRWYSYTGDKYRVSQDGVLLVPQVCADFVVDTVDRVAGSWYVGERIAPIRVTGRYDMRSDVAAAGFDPRRINELIEFFKQRPKFFEIVFEGRGPRVGDVVSLKDWSRDAMVTQGDLVVVSGRVPWDVKDEHSHSFFVFGTDASGSIDSVVGNTGVPRVKTLEEEAKRAPKRRVTAVVRFTDEFLEKIAGLG